MHARANISSMFAPLSKGRRRPSHVLRKQGGRAQSGLRYGELANGTRPVGRPFLGFRDVCKRDLQHCNIRPADLNLLDAKVKYIAIPFRVEDDALLYSRCSWLVSHESTGCCEERTQKSQQKTKRNISVRMFAFYFLV